ncbi:MAG: hypothetical protein R2712_25875, partial [Vicinamibacterales bacterium]
MPSRAWAVIAALLACSCGSPDALAIDRLHECTIDEGPAGAYCGTLSVYEDRASRQGRQIPLKIVVAPALRRDAAPDPLFVLAGGPGQPAASMASELLPGFRRFRTDRDIVLVDQRGTGDSNRLGCDPSPDELDDISVDDDRVEARFRACLATLDADP